MASAFRTLIVDDEETYALSLKRLLMRRGVEADVAGTFAAGRAEIEKRHYDLVVLDYMLPDGSGLDLIPPIRALRPAPIVLMMTAYGTIENAVEAMRRGAQDYITKSPDLPAIVERILDAEKIARLKAGLPDASLSVEMPGLLGESEVMRETRKRIAEVAKSSDTTVLLMGESGTGKGVAARAIHALSSRSTQPFVVIDCVALPETLAESELFGHEKGAFTGAEQRKLGRLEVAGGGTLLLDEVGDMELPVQGKLLRALEERTFERVGGVKPMPLHARVIAASHRDLGTLVEQEKFRLDLFHRLSVFPIEIPPLRARGEDVLLLANHFIAEFAGKMKKTIAPIDDRQKETRDLFVGYSFPGNVRELKNVMERAVILAGDAITPDFLPERMRDSQARLSDIRLGIIGGTAGGLTMEFRPGVDTLEGVDRKLVEDAIGMAQGNKSRAAEILGISRFALLRRIEKYGL